MTGVQPFVARFGKLWHGARAVTYADGTRGLALGFVVAEVNRDLEAPDAIARQLAAAMNLTERLADIDHAVASAQRLIDDLTRHIGQMSIPDYSLLITVPADLAQLRSWLTAARNASAGADEPAAEVA